ncbi:hypothetical protein WICANDRAFT_78071 [Wickerhamomyces anomalus NRRL Y-366-8]|uniref:V-type proton ATPase subunit G n=1 Tax=Wickerhamomyces anomalus (strain ATCC 58044 / CBS 1984 / NCYC 433 / NRRL Y-366-8) TaxID=683960 RepID=A0A1E3P7M8_WICAA|nr:uncharacterized protein WICANDRAFT_78071 [Wickerhamomyces anomalus NRRL Y-366-8]ODQ61441.1 hypothetical protein WICANDRAFT_78071 [Wickerhamomyces anomalus NRRL Y-366-8]
MSNQSGIATLLRAEKEAHEIVSKSRAYRTSRLKAAKTDASSEIAAYKQKKEQELKQYEAEHSGLNETADKEAEAQVKEELEKIQKTASEKQAEVVKLLINAVTKPTPELHINASS